MDTGMIASLYEYGAWANERLLAQAEKLTAEQFRRHWSQGAQSIHESFVHTLGGDWRWFHRWRGVPPPPAFVAADWPTVDAIGAKWAELIPQRAAYLASLREDDLRGIIQFAADERVYDLTRWQGLLHCANHGTQHRSEIAAMLTDAGHSPGDLDYLFFCLSRKESRR
jgi:uncharacterized damage-inducible protein DinB